MLRPIIYIIITTVALLSSCSRRPGYVIPEKKMMEVLYDIRLTQSIYLNDPQFKSDEKKDALVAGVLEKHKITQVELDSSLLWYSDNIQAYSEINDSVAARLRARNEALMSSRIVQNTKGRQRFDLVIPTYYYLDKYTPTLSFNIDSSKIKGMKNISAFNFKFDVQGLNDLQKAEAAVFFTYKDTLIRKVIPIDRNEQYSLSKPQLPDSLLNNISGYIHIRNNTGISSGVILYNMSYIDSVSVSPAIQSNATESRRPVDRRPEVEMRESKVEEVKTEQSTSEQTVKPAGQASKSPVLRGKRSPR